MVRQERPESHRGACCDGSPTSILGDCSVGDVPTHLVDSRGWRPADSVLCSTTQGDSCTRTLGSFMGVYASHSRIHGVPGVSLRRRWSANPDQQIRGAGSSGHRRQRQQHYEAEEEAQRDRRSEGVAPGEGAGSSHFFGGGGGSGGGGGGGGVGGLGG